MAEDQRKKQQHDEQMEKEKEKETITSSNSTEYIVHNWLEALFAWFQVIVLWHEPQVSLCTISTLLSSFLLLIYFAPRFYATLLMAIFIYNLNKFWFRHVWPEIRVPPGHDRELEMRADVDRFTLLHPHLMTLTELKYHLVNLTKISHYYLHKLLLLRQQKPAAFCSLLCILFSCSAYLGSLLSGLSLIFLSLVIIMSAPGIYTYLMSEEYKIELQAHLLNLLEQINQELKISQQEQEEGHQQQQQQEQPSSSGAILLGTRLLDNFKTRGLQLFTSVPISIKRQPAATESPNEATSTSQSSMLAHLKEDGAKVLYNLIDVTLMSGNSGAKSATIAESQRPPRRTNYVDEDEEDDAKESEPLIGGQNDGGGGDDEDGFVILG